MQSKKSLQRKLKRANLSKRRKILGGIYKQLVFSNKGKQANGDYRNLSENYGEESRLFVCYIAEN
jgi:hypothetical protein